MKCRKCGESKDYWELSRGHVQCWECDVFVDYGLTRSDIDAIEDVLYADPQPPSMARFKGRLMAMKRGYREYRYRVYVRLLRMQRKNPTMGIKI